jgi:hypothetical protein
MLMWRGVRMKLGTFFHKCLHLVETPPVTTASRIGSRVIIPIRMSSGRKLMWP